jgi:hypothetical protein
MAWWHDDGAVVAVRSAGVDMRSGKRGGEGGDGALGRSLSREDERGKKKGGAAVMGHPL